MHSQRFKWCYVRRSMQDFRRLVLKVKNQIKNKARTVWATGDQFFKFRIMLKSSNMERGQLHSLQRWGLTFLWEEVQRGKHAVYSALVHKSGREAIRLPTVLYRQIGSNIQSWTYVRRSFENQHRLSQYLLLPTRKPENQNMSEQNPVDK